LHAINWLRFSAYGMHGADQIAIVTVPLIAALVFNAAPEFIGMLVACQALAHLLGSIPFGLIVDRIDANRVAVAATVISAVGNAGVALSIYAASLVWFAIMVTLSGFGIVLFVLASLSIVPTIVETRRLAGANARIEMPRALSAFAVPLAIGVWFGEGFAQFVFIFAVLFSIAAMATTLRLPQCPTPTRPKKNVLKMIADGSAFVFQHPLLRPITVCSLCWNLAFSALLVVMVPLIIDYYHAEPSVFGVALSAFGGAMIVGSWLSGQIFESVRPNVILLFGPGSSLLAMLALYLIPAKGPVEAIYAVFFLLGFGPSMWMIAQNSVRQLVTPAPMLGCVNAVIQTAIYGVRPLGALAGGLVAGALSPRAGVLFVLLAFGLSFAAALFSQLRAVRSYVALRNELDLA